MLTELLVELDKSMDYREMHEKIMSIIGINESYEDMGFRIFKHIKINDDLELSIQGSFLHCCRPQKTLPVEEYESMELAIFKEQDFADVREIMDNEILIHKLNKFFNGVVYNDVPVKLLEELCKELIHLNK